MKDIAEQIADGDLTPSEAAKQLALVTSMLRRLKDSETALRGYLTDHLDPKEHLTTALGVVSYKRGAESRWRVKDPVAFGQWLVRNGEESSVEEVLYPVEFITKPDAIEALVHKHGGEQPDGVELSGGRSDSVATSKVKAWDEIISDPKLRETAANALKMTGMPQIEADPAHDDDDDDEEAFSWETI